MRKIISSLIVFFLASPVYAATDRYTGGTGPNKAPASIKELISLIGEIAYLMQIGLYAVATVFFVLAAYSFLFSKGEPAEVKKAQDSILYGVIALLIGILAAGVPSIIASVLHVTN